MATKQRRTKTSKKTNASSVGPVGIRTDVRSRPFLAGVIIKTAGRTAGITEKMVKELDKLYGTANPRESLFCLRNAHGAIRGYLEGDMQEGKK